MTDATLRENRVTEWICLEYHNVVPTTPALSGSPDYFSVSTAAFNQQLDRIRQRGLLGCSIAAAMRSDGRPRLAISFDDGDAGQYERAFPALVARGMTATFFIVTGWVGRPAYVTWNQLREMRDAGMSIQSHTHTHAPLTELSPERVAEELRRSREEIDRELDQQTDTIAFPGGFFPSGAYREQVRDAGYRVMATSNWGRNGGHEPADGVFVVRRCTVHGAPSLEWFDRVVDRDRWLAWRHGAKEMLLNGFKAALGPGRYVRWRSRFLDGVGKVR